VKKIQKLLCLLLSLSLISFHLAPLQAAIIDNDQIITQATPTWDRERLLEVLERQQARDQLEALGVSPEDVKKRVAQMTDTEVARLNRHLDESPAGGGVLGLLLILFIVFIITDMLGATDIFPFVKKI